MISFAQMRRVYFISATAANLFLALDKRTGRNRGKFARNYEKILGNIGETMVILRVKVKGPTSDVSQRHLPYVDAKYPAGSSAPLGLQYHGLQW